MCVHARVCECACACMCVIVVERYAIHVQTIILLHPLVYVRMCVHARVCECACACVCVVCNVCTCACTIHIRDQVSVHYNTFLTTFMSIWCIVYETLDYIVRDKCCIY